MSKCCLIIYKYETVVAMGFEVNQTAATKKLKMPWKVRIIWMVWTKSELKVHFITLNQSLRLEWE